MINSQLTREQFVAFVRAAELAVVATVDHEGNPEAAVLELAALGDGTLIFKTKTSARKVDNLFHHNRVALVVGWKPITLQIEGEAELLMGVDAEAMDELYEEQFPGRPTPAEPLSLYRVTPDWLRYCEWRPGQPPVIAEGLWV